MNDLTKPRTRLEAAKEGLSKYFTGKPCIRGHNTYRYTNTGACSACLLVYKKKYNFNYAPDMVEVKVMVHKEDYQIILNYIEAINLARSLQQNHRK